MVNFAPKLLGEIGDLISEKKWVKYFNLPLKMRKEIIDVSDANHSIMILRFFDGSGNHSISYRFELYILRDIGKGGLVMNLEITKPDGRSMNINFIYRENDPCSRSGIANVFTDNFDCHESVLYLCDVRSFLAN